MFTKEQIEWFMEDVGATVGPTDLISEVLLEAASKVNQDNVIKDVPVLGFKSKNGYDYSETALKEGAHLYEGVDVYLNHERDKNKERKSEDKFGFLQNAYYKEGCGIRADIVANPKHSFFETFKWWVENHPERLGLSHHAGGTFNKKLNTVESITVVKSVDIVSKAATVSGLRESVLTEGVIEDSINMDKAVKKFEDVVNKAIDMIRSAQWEFGTSLATRAGGVAEVAKDLQSIMQEFKTANPQLDPTITQEGEEMDWDKLNLSDLAQKRPDLVESIRSDTITRVKAQEAKILESVKDVPENLRTEFFMEQVTGAVSAGNEELLTKLVDNQKGLAPRKPRSTVVDSTKVVVEGKKEGEEEGKKETKDTFLESLGSLIKKEKGGKK